MAELGPWHISPNLLDSFYTLVFLLGVSALVVLHWEFIIWLVTFRQRARKATRKALSDNIKKATDSVQSAVQSFGELDTDWVANMIYMGDRLQVIGIGFNPPTPQAVERVGYDRMVEGLKLVYLYLLDEDLKNAAKIIRTMNSFYADKK